MKDDKSSLYLANYFKQFLKKELSYSKEYFYLGRNLFLNAKI